MISNTLAGALAAVLLAGCSRGPAAAIPAVEEAEPTPSRAPKSALDAGNPPPADTHDLEAERTHAVALWSRTAVVKRVRELSVPAEGLETDVTLSSGIEEWHLHVTCRHYGAPCRPHATVDFEVRFDQIVEPDVWIMWHREQAPEKPRLRSPGYGCFEAMFQAPPTHCTFPLHDGWRSDGGPNDARARTYIARVENRGAPIAAHVKIAAVVPDRDP